MGGTGLGLARQLLAGMNPGTPHPVAAVDADADAATNGVATDGAASDNHAGVIEIK